MPAFLYDPPWLHLWTRVLQYDGILCSIWVKLTRLCARVGSACPAWIVWPRGTSDTPAPVEGTRDSWSYADRGRVVAELGIARRDSHDGSDGHLRLQHAALRILAGDAELGGDYQFRPSASVGHDFRIASLIC